MARADLSRAVKIDRGRRAMEGDIESAFLILEEARNALEQDNIEHARTTVTEVIGLLRTDESRLIVEDNDALEDAIRFLEGIRWD